MTPSMSPNIHLAKNVTSRDAERDEGIDPLASVHPSAQLGAGCEIGPFAVIGPNVQLGVGCVVQAHAVVWGPTTMGSRNVVHSFACLGGAPQDRRHNNEPTELRIGNFNEFREHVTVNRGTCHGGGSTEIGDHNLLMAYTHVAHDCQIGNHVCMANHATLAGHTTVGDYAVFGGLVGVGTFLRIGESAMLAAGSMIERDVPPFCIVAGDRARLRAVNRVGLDRREFDEVTRRGIKGIIRALKTRGRSLPSIVAEFEHLGEQDPSIARLLDFIRHTPRGLTR